MTTAVPTSVDWVRLAVGGDEISVEPAPGIELRLAIEVTDDEGYLDPLTAGPSPRLHIALDLLPRTHEAIARCEMMAARILERLGSHESALAPLREFSLKAALGGDGLLYDRVTAPRLILKPSGLPFFDDEQPVPAVRVFAAGAPSNRDAVYVMTRSK
jgi:hypothetical protein